MAHRPLRAIGALSLTTALVVAGGVVSAQSPSAGAVPTLSASCAKDQLALKNPGRLTLSTDNPAYSPWWGGDPAIQYPNEPAGGDGWELGDPYSGEGYEGAVAYAVAAALGFAPEEVDWVANAVFEQAFAPGPKPFDFHLAQISIKPERAQAVDFSAPYFDSRQALIAMTGTPITKVTTIAGLKDFKLGAGAFTTASQLIEDVIKPTAEMQVFNSNADAIQPLQNGTVDGLILDVQSALYMRDAQLENYDTPDPEAVVVGQFDAAAQENQMGIVLEKGSALTACVNEAIGIVRASGQLQQIYDQWISTGQEIPTFQ